MKVILTQDVRGQGKRGQMIEVSDGYARNFLLPRKLAQEATADNVNTMKMNDKAAQERQAKERAEALEIRNRMKDMTVVVIASLTSARSCSTSRSRLSACTRSSASSAMRSTPTSRSRSRRAKQALIF